MQALVLIALRAINNEVQRPRCLAQPTSCERSPPRPAVLTQVAQPVFPHDRGPLARVDVDVGGIAAHLGQQARVHHAAPQGRHIGQREHAEVADGQLWHIVKVAQRLVAAQRVGMVVGVPLQMEQGLAEVS